MHCNEIRELISCMLDNELSAEQSALVTEHVAGCPECMRVFEVFHAVSVSMEELEEVPEGFTAGVMERVHAAAAVPKKRKPRILRFAALAACLALVLMTGSGMVTTYRGTSQHSTDTANYGDINTKYVQRPEPVSSPTPELSEEPQGGLFSLFRNDDSMTAADETLDGDVNGDMDISVSPLPSDSPDGLTQDAANGSGEMTADSPAATPVVSPAATPDVTPIVTPAATPEASPVPQPGEPALTALLAAAEPADPAQYTADWHYQVMVSTAEGDVELLVWVMDGRVICKNPAANEAWVAVGTPDQLTALLGPVPTPMAEVEPTETPAQSEES